MAAGAGPSASAQEVDATVLAGPGAFVFPMTYLTPAAVVSEGASARFQNFDLALHDVCSDERDESGDRLFCSRLIGLGAEDEVAGVPDLDPGAYGFHCTLHPWMQGTLQVLPGGGSSGQGPQEPEDLPSEDWTVYGRDLGNSRSSPTGPAPDDVPLLSEAWAYDHDEGGFTGTPIVADGAVYMGSVTGRVVALDAATGEERWAVDLPSEEETAEVTASPAYADGVVYVPVTARRGGAYTPYVVALDADDGSERWKTYVDEEQPFGDLYGSPVVWETTVDGEPWEALYIGTSSWDSAASGADELHLGTVVALDPGDGEVLWRTYMHEDAPRTRDDVPVDPETGAPYDGAAVWSTPAIDTETASLYVGTGNGYRSAHALTDSLVGLDAVTGDLLGHYQGTAHDSWRPSAAHEGFDADFGSSPQLIEGPDGEAWLGAGQKNNHLVHELSGESEPKTMAGLTRYHVIDRGTMEPEWVQPLGPGYWWGGITGSTAYDGDRVYGSVVYGSLWALADDGTPAWYTSSHDTVIHFGPTTEANGVVYSTDSVGFVNAWDAATGAPLWKRPIGGPSWGGVAVVGETVYVARGITGAAGSIHAFALPDES